MVVDWESYHPVVGFIYFFVSIGFCMIVMHPAVVIVSLVVAIGYFCMINRSGAIKFCFGVALPVGVLSAVVNPLFNHQGVSILFYLWDNPVTMESVVYGLCSGGMFAAIMCWFACFSKVISSDKIIYLLGNIVPAVGLILSMTMRFVPRFIDRAKVIDQGQKCLYMQDEKDVKMIEKIKRGCAVVSIMITWSLESAIDTADSMKARGYGISGRSTFALRVISRRDLAALCWIVVGTVVLLFGLISGLFGAKFFPFVSFSSGGMSWIVCAVYGLISGMPIIFGIAEELKWKLKLKFVMKLKFIK